MTLLAATHLRKSFGGVAALRDVSFTMASGERLAVIGPNGAGKSTCFNVICGQLRPDAGAVLFDDKVVTGMTPRAMWRHGVARTFQVARIFTSLSVLANVQAARLAASRRVFALFGRAAREGVEAAQALLDEVGIGHLAARSAAALAYGDVKRLELALALASRPRLLLMDEPTAGMASVERHALMELVSRLVDERRMGVLFTEHSLDVVFAHADRVLVLAAGEIVAHGTPAQVRLDARVRALYLGQAVAP